MGAGLRYRGLSLQDSLEPGAPPLLQFAITRVITVAAGRFAPGHLGELTQQVPFDMVDAVLADTRTAQRRVRGLPSRVVVYLLLAGCLFAGSVWRHCGYCSTCCAARQPRPPDRCGGTGCWSALSTAPS